jgi:hypothetical protein
MLSVAIMPQEIQIHILQYTYKPQPKYLQKDIINYVNTIDVLYDIYLGIWENDMYEANLWIQRDFFRFINLYQATPQIFTTSFYNFWLRYFMVNTYAEAIKFSKNTQNNTKFMWGLFTPAERERFFKSVLIT